VGYVNFSPEVRWLLVNHSKEKQKLLYLSNAVQIPKIGPRPPYYCHPRYVPYYPII